MPSSTTAIGCRVKSGWAMTVLLAGPVDSPRVPRSAAHRAQRPVGPRYDPALPCGTPCRTDQPRHRRAADAAGRSLRPAGAHWPGPGVPSHGPSADAHRHRCRQHHRSGYHRQPTYSGPFPGRPALSHCRGDGGEEARHRLRGIGRAGTLRDGSPHARRLAGSTTTCCHGPGTHCRPSLGGTGEDCGRGGVACPNGPLVRSLR
jgi:hypothetical protein